MEAFDDIKLVNLARYTLFTMPYSVKRDMENDELDKVEKLLDQAKLSNPERNFLLDFIAKNRGTRSLGITTMKSEIFRIIGFNSTNNYGTLNRAEVEAIYHWFKTKHENGK